MEFKEYTNPESNDYDIISSFNSSEDDNIDYGYELVNLIGVLEDVTEDIISNYGITMNEYLNPTKEVVLKVKDRLNKNKTLIKLITGDKYSYKCFDILKELVNTNSKFRDVLLDGSTNGKITGFYEELWNKIHSQNIRGISNFEDVFKDGANIGYCTVAAKQLSYSLDSCFICGGVLKVLENTPNCKDGSHTWILYDDKIIDTSLMLVIDKEYIEQLGYKEENRYDPNIDPIYQAAKSFTLDDNLRK